MERFTTRPELRGTFGMVASTHWLASAAGMSMLERGGNAFDAAVAAGFVLQVVEPHLNGPGGEVPILLYSAERDEVLVVDGQGTAPAAATIERFRELGHELVPGTGLLAACVPGAFDAWLLLLREFGTLPLADVLEPAIGYAESGYPLVPGIVRSIAQAWSRSSATSGRPRRSCTCRFRRPASSSGTATWRRPTGACSPSRRASSRPRATSSTAASSPRRSSRRARCSTATTSPRGGRRSSSRSRAPTTAGRCSRPGRGRRGRSSCSSSRCSTASSYATARAPDFVHTVVECAKLAFADREAWYGDVEVPLDDLLSPAYAEERRKLVGEEASGELRPGSPGGREPRLPHIPELQAVEPGTGEPTGGDTCHVDVVDRFGNAVSATPSGGWLHGSPVIPGLGFCLGTRAQMFWLEEGLPSSLAPGKRPRSTLSPTLARRDGELLAFGTPGGDHQDQWSLVFFLSLVHFGLNAQEAIDAPMFHTDHFPESFYPRQPRPRVVQIEERFGRKTLAELERRGHLVEPQGPWSLGRVSAAGRNREGLLYAAANPRGMQGYAVGR